MPGINRACAVEPSNPRGHSSVHAADILAVRVCNGSAIRYMCLVHNRRSKSVGPSYVCKIELASRVGSSVLGKGSRAEKRYKLLTVSKIEVIVVAKVVVHTDIELVVVCG